MIKLLKCNKIQEIHIDTLISNLCVDINNSNKSEQESSSLQSNQQTQPVVDKKQKNKKKPSDV